VGEPVRLRLNAARRAFVGVGSYLASSLDALRSVRAAPVLIGPGEVIGELAALRGKLRTATAMALDDTVLLTLSRDELLTELSP
jgi:CRP-like cAMP-binding protein